MNKPKLILYISILLLFSPALLFGYRVGDVRDVGFCGDGNTCKQEICVKEKYSFWSGYYCTEWKCNAWWECDDANNINTDNCVNCENAECGDNYIHTGVETCDNSNLNNETCVTLGHDYGILQCDSDCLGFDTSGCHDSVCGDDNAEPTEACDGDDLKGTTCANLGFASGTLACNSDCGSFDTSGCREIVCGDGVVEIGEECDDGNLQNNDGCDDHCKDESTTIPDNNPTGISSSKEYSVSGNFCSDATIEVCVDISHSYIGDLTVELISPDGSSRILHNKEGGTANNLVECWDVTSLAGSDPSGTWTLVVIDHSNRDVGTLNSWTLNIDTSMCPVCGDGLHESGEECDEGAQNSDTPNATCRINCKLPTCGDGILDDSMPCLEICDDGNTADGDYCSSDCQLITGSCGDGILQNNEQCDDGNNNENDYCNSSCKTIGYCGDGVQQSNEICDDGNNNTGDYCSPDCQTETGNCGDGIVQDNEQCDDMNSDENDYCNNSCETIGSCGDGVVQGSLEQCDDANGDPTDACVNCQSAVCGDGHIQYGVEECEQSDVRDCIEVGKKYGVITCSSECKWNESACTNDTASNKVIALKHFSYKSSNLTPNPAKISAAELEDMSKEKKYTPESKKPIDAASRGWFIDLPPETMLVGNPVYCDDGLYFVTYTKATYSDNVTVEKNICKNDANLGWSHLWQVNAWNGKPVRENVWFKDERIWMYLGKGIASQPIVENNCERIIVGAPGDPDGGDDDPFKTPDKDLPPGTDAGDRPLPHRCRNQ